MARASSASVQKKWLDSPSEASDNSRMNFLPIGLCSECCGRKTQQCQQTYSSIVLVQIRHFVAVPSGWTCSERAETRQNETMDQRHPTATQGFRALLMTRWAGKLALRTVQEECQRSGRHAFDQSENTLKQHTGDETDGPDLRNV